MKTFKVIAFTILTLILTGCTHNFKDGDMVKVTIAGKKFTLEVAKTIDKQRAGLSGRKTLEADRGMLFVHDQADYLQFWMKDTLIPLQILFVNGCEIVEVKEMQVAKDPANPETIYKAITQANKAIELNKATVPESVVGQKIKELCK